MHKLSFDAFIFIIFICEPFCWKYRSNSSVIKIFLSDFVVTSFVEMQGVIFTARFTHYWRHCQQYGKEYSIWKSFRQSMGVYSFYFTVAKLTFFTVLCVRYYFLHYKSAYFHLLHAMDDSSIRPPEIEWHHFL